MATTSDFNTILKRVRSNLLESGVRYVRADTTSAGNASGTTMISTTLSELDDAWNNMDCTIITGDSNLNGLNKRVEDFKDIPCIFLFLYGRRTNRNVPCRIIWQERAGSVYRRPYLHHSGYPNSSYYRSTFVCAAF